MKRAFGLLALVMFTGVTYGQMRDNRDSQLSCDGNRGSEARSCEIRESTLGPSGSLQIEPGHNGRIVVKGWSQNSVRVRAVVETWAPSDAGARNLTSQVHVDAGGGLIRATGPENNGFLQNGDEGWAVSFEVFAPWSTDLKLESHNGGVTVSDIRGRITFQTHNGSINLTRIAGDVSGETHNGAIQAELQGNTWEGRQLELSTYNGGITLSMPASYSASLQTETARGRVLSDFPVTLTGRIDSSKRDFNIGAGGPLIKVSTHNGAIRLKSM
jgi:putative adhesin